MPVLRYERGQLAILEKTSEHTLLSPYVLQGITEHGFVSLLLEKSSHSRLQFKVLDVKLVLQGLEVMVDLGHKGRHLVNGQLRDLLAAFIDVFKGGLNTFELVVLPLPQKMHLVHYHLGRLDKLHVAQFVVLVQLHSRIG